MGSEVPVDTQIFYKDKNNELKGPFTELQMQERYREKMLEGSFLFCFLREGEIPSGDTEYFTLDELCTRNGIGSPFILPSDVVPAENTGANSEMKFRSPEEDLEETKVLSTVEDSMEISEKKRETELSKFTKWTDFFANFYMIYLDTVKSSNFNIITREYFSNISSKKKNMIIEFEEARLMCVEKIISKMKKEVFFYCSFCDFACFNYKQCLVHHNEPIHIWQEMVPHTHLSDINSYFLRIITDDIRSKWENEEDRFASKIAKKYASVAVPGDSRLFPSDSFAEDVYRRYFRMLEEKKRYLEEHIIAELTPIERLTNKFDIWAYDGLATRLVTELNEHIGNKMTYCVTCNVVTGTRKEYYKHLLHLSHLSMEPHDGYAYFTFAVNITKKDYISDDYPIPKGE